MCSMSTEVNPFDILSGKVVQTDKGTFWFKELGINVDKNGLPVYENIHRLDGPAILWHVGDKEWWIEGKRHRLNGPALDRVSGYKAWYKDDQLHRLDGPAITEVNGLREWYKNGKRHRLDGPAVYGGYRVKRWYIDGIYYNEHDFNNKVKCMTK